MDSAADRWDEARFPYTSCAIQDGESKMDLPNIRDTDSETSDAQQIQTT